MKTKRIIALLTAVLCLSFASCNVEDKNDTNATDTKAATAKVSGESVISDGTEDVPESDENDMKAVVGSVKEFYAEDTKFVYKADDDADDNYEFMFTYYFEDEKFLSAVSDYVLTVGEGVDTFAMITFKEGTDKALIDEAVGILEGVYAENLKNTYAPYDPASAKVAEEYTVITKENTVVFVISAESQDAIIEVVG